MCVCVTVLRLYPNTTLTSKTEGVSRSVCPTLCDPMDLPGSSDQARIYLLQEIFLTWTELRSPALQVESLSSEPQGSQRLSEPLIFKKK